VRAVVGWANVDFLPESSVECGCGLIAGRVFRGSLWLDSLMVLQGNANTEFEAMIQSPDGQYGLLLADPPAETNAWMVDNF
jgi:hypothetical protein